VATCPCGQWPLDEYGARCPSCPRPTLTLGDLSGPDGNAFAVLGAARRALRDAGACREVVDAFVAEATAGDYRHLLATVDAWFQVRQPVYVPRPALAALDDPEADA
jgi:hypothetical protein